MENNPNLMWRRAEDNGVTEPCKEHPATPSCPSDKPPCAPACPLPTCCPTEWGLYGYPLATVYVPMQEFCRIYDTDTALSRGTLFRDLDKPFYGKHCNGNDDDKGEGCRCRTGRSTERGLCGEHERYDRGDRGERGCSCRSRSVGYR